MLDRFQSGEAASSDRDRRFGQIHLDEIQHQRLVERVIETCRDDLRFGHRSVFKPTEQLANVLRHAHRHPLAYTEANQPSPIALTEPQMSALLAASPPHIRCREPRVRRFSNIARVRSQTCPNSATACCIVPIRPSIAASQIAVASGRELVLAAPGIISGRY
jgi:hypothetical protein